MLCWLRNPGAGGPNASPYLPGRALSFCSSARRSDDVSGCARQGLHFLRGAQDLSNAPRLAIGLFDDIFHRQLMPDEFSSIRRRISSSCSGGLGPGQCPGLAGNGLVGGDVASLGRGGAGLWRGLSRDRRAFRFSRASTISTTPSRACSSSCCSSSQVLACANASGACATPMDQGRLLISRSWPCSWPVTSASPKPHIASGGLF